MIEFVPSGYISIREALSRSIWRMRARPLAAPRVSSGSGDCSLRNVSRIGTIQRNRPLQRAKIMARAAYPQDRSSTRIVSGGGFWPIRRELSRHFKYMARGRIPEFESYHPSHAVVSSAVMTGVFHGHGGGKG